MKATLAARPYPPLTITPEQWRAVPLTWLDAGDLIGTQDVVRLDVLLGIAPRSPALDPFPNVVAWDGRLYVDNGHVRLARRWLAGQQFVQAHVVRHPADPAASHQERRTA